MSLFFVGDLNILADKRLSPIDKLVYFALVSYMKKENGIAFPRFATISKRTGISKASIQRSCTHLAKLQLITKKRLQSTNQYLLSQQLALEKIVKNRQKYHADNSETSQRRVLIKPYNYTKYGNNYNRYNKSNFLPPSTEQPLLVYNGKKYKESGREGPWIEYYCNEDGSQIRKHSFKNTIEEKKTSKNKFIAAAKKAVACAS